MPEFTAQDVKALRDDTGAGMMDAKRALTENDGDPVAAKAWLRERGLGKAAERSDRANTQGAVAVSAKDGVAALVELKCETDFVAKNADFVALARELADLVADQGDAAAATKQDAIDDLRVKLKENIEVGEVIRFEAGPGHVLDSYLHVQNERGVNGVLIELEGGTPEVAHDVAVHIAFGRPSTITRDEVPAEEVEREREALLAETKNSGKPEAAWPKIVDGKLTGWFKRVGEKGVKGGALLDQPFSKDDKKTVQQILGDAKVVRFAQVEIGA